LIQQALLQVLQPKIDSTFSEHSYGFRPARSALDAVKAAKAHVQSGRRVVVDLENFFDRGSNRPMRICMPGGVAGAQPIMAAPYADTCIMPS
jgi:hypothetical protein